MQKKLEVYIDVVILRKHEIKGELRYVGSLMSEITDERKILCID